MYKIYVINLKSDVKKKQHMENLFRKFNLQVEFIDAIDGRKLNNKFISDVSSSVISIKEIGRNLSRGELGCLLSHKKIYKKIIDENIEMALVLEDDIYFDGYLLSILNNKDKFTDNWELILLGHHTGSSRKIDTKASFWNQKHIMHNFKLVRPCENSYGTYGYFITKNGVKKLLKRLSVISRPIDHFTGDSKFLNLYTINPAPIKIHEYLSDNFHSMKERCELQKKHVSLYNNSSESILKKIATYLGVVQVIIDLREKFFILLKKIKPLRKYK